MQIFECLNVLILILIGHFLLHCLFHLFDYLFDFMYEVETTNGLLKTLFSKELLSLGKIITDFKTLSFLVVMNIFGCDLDGGCEFFQVGLWT